MLRRLTINFVLLKWMDSEFALNQVSNFYLTLDIDAHGMQCALLRYLTRLNY